MNPTISAPKMTSAGFAQSLQGYLRRVLERIEDEQQGAQEPGKGPGAPQKLRSRGLVDGPAAGCLVWCQEPERSVALLGVAGLRYLRSDGL